MAVLETLVRRLAAAAAAPAIPPPVSTGPAAATAGVPPELSPAAATPAAISPAAVPPGVPRPLEGPMGSQAPIDPTVRPSPTAAPPEPTPSSAGQPPRGRPAASPRPSRPSAAGMVSSLSERWIGQRVFLGIGVVALLMAAGYLLKLSFERGWISPVLRCAGGGAAGRGGGALGWRVEPRLPPHGPAPRRAGGGLLFPQLLART